MKYRVLVFKEAPILVYTGLNKAIGKPRDMEKNNEEGGKYFDSDFDISIPVQMTAEYKQSNQNNLVLINYNINDMIFRVLRRSTNMMILKKPKILRRKRGKRDLCKSNKKPKQC